MGKLEIKFEDWVEYHYEGDDAPIGGMGGWFNANQLHEKDKPTSMVWEDYLNAHKEGSHPYLEALKNEIKNNNLQITGESHQWGNAPLFSDGTVGRFSYRAWGDLMAAIYSTKEKPLNYMAYYM